MGERSFENGILGKALSADGRRGRRPSVMIGASGAGKTVSVS